MQSGLFPLAILVVLSSAEARESFFGAAKWTVDSNRDGIEVSSWRPEGSGCKAVQGKGVAEVPVGKSLSILRNVLRRPEWFPMVGQARVVGTPGKGEWTEAWQMNTPPGVSDREVVFKISVAYDPAEKTLVVPYHSVDHGPVFYRNEKTQEGTYTRARIIAGEFVIRPTQVNEGREGTEVTYRLCFDMGGSVSSWLVESFMASYPRDVLKAMRREAAREEVLEDPRVRKVFSGEARLQEIL